MSSRVVFNGKEYDSLESMPPEVRKEYEAVLGALGAADREKVESALGHASGVRMNVTVHRKFRVNGVDYDSVEAMPADVRAAYERAVASSGSTPPVGSPPPAPQSGAMPQLPPAIDADDARRGTLLRAALWVAAGLAVLVWLLARR